MGPSVRERGPLNHPWLVSNDIILKSVPFDRFVFQYFAYNTTIACTNDQNRFWVWVCKNWNMCHHFLITHFILLCKLNHSIQKKCTTPGFCFGNQDILSKLFNVITGPGIHERVADFKFCSRPKKSLTKNVVITVYILSSLVRKKM